MLLFDSKCARQSFPSSIYHLIIHWIVSFTLISHHVKPMLTIQKITANLYRYIWIFNRIDSFPNPSFTSPLDPIQKIKSPFLFNHNRSSHNKLFISRITIVSNQFDNSNFYELISYINSWLFYFFYWLWNRAPARQNRKIISKFLLKIHYWNQSPGDSSLWLNRSNLMLTAVMKVLKSAAMGRPRRLVYWNRPKSKCPTNGIRRTIVCRPSRGRRSQRRRWRWAAHLP